MKIEYCSGCMRRIAQDEQICPVCGTVHGKDENPAYALPIGTGLDRDRYQIGKSQGQGGFGITYVGRDKNLGRKVAVKEFYYKNAATRTGTTVTWDDSQPLDPEKLLHNFRREARKVAKLGEIPGTVKVYDVFDENNTSYMVMNFVEGETLKNRLCTGPMSFRDCYALLRPVMEALAEIHRQKIVHRDISPDNIMINKQGRAVLLDFGASKDLSPEQTELFTSSIAVGKRGFAPPEQWTGDNIGPWTDIYAMCATIYVCLTKETLTDSYLREHDAQKREIVFPDGFDSELAAVLKKGMALQEKDRYQSMPELISALDRIASAPPPPPTPQPNPKREKLEKLLAQSPGLEEKFCHMYRTELNIGWILGIVVTAISFLGLGFERYVFSFWLVIAISGLWFLSYIILDFRHRKELGAGLYKSYKIYPHVILLTKPQRILGVIFSVSAAVIYAFMMIGITSVSFGSYDDMCSYYLTMFFLVAASCAPIQVIHTFALSKRMSKKNKP